MNDDLLARLESYYDAVPRRFARVEECGPFTLFLGEPDGWTYYARPRLGGAGFFTQTDVTAVAARLAEHGLPQDIEWVHETTPTLVDAVRATGRFELEELPLLALDGDLAVTAPPLPDGVSVRLLGPADADAVAAVSAVSAVSFASPGTARGAPGTAERDKALAPPRQQVLDLLADGGARMAVAEHERDGILAAGRMLPLGGVAEVVGVSTLPSARRQGLGAAVTAALAEDARHLGLTTVFLTASSPAVARIYAGIGFRPVGTGWAAQAR